MRIKLLLLGLLGLLFSGCAAFSTSSPPSPLPSYYPSSHFQERWGWVRGHGTPPTFFAGKHRIVLKLGTRYAMVDGRSVNLKSPLYSLGREIYIPSEIIKQYPYLKYQTHSSIPPQKIKKPVFSPPTPPSTYTPPPIPKKTTAPSTVEAYYTPQFTSMPRNLRLPRHNWKYIVIHHSSTTQGCAKSFNWYHKYRRHWKNGLGYHFVIGNGTQSGEGEVEIGPRWKKQQAGAHAGCKLYNEKGIGICLVGNFQTHRPSARQFSALIKLTRLLMARYRIPLSRVLPHRKVRPAPTDCPGKRFPWKTFINGLR